MPGEPVYGNSWPAAAYFPAIAFLTAGIVQGLVFGALAMIISYLKSLSRE